VKSLACSLFILLVISFSYAQVIERPLPSAPSRQATPSASLARTQSANPLYLPFWDDFSYTDSLSFPQQDLWLFGNSVLLNNGLAVHQPSKNVVTFDGVDSLGKPYNINDILAKGFADKLVSQPIRMDLVDPALRNTVYISFFYQVKGLGEIPDNGDKLVLQFKDDHGNWLTVFEVENGDALSPDVFYQVLTPVVDTKFYHDDFQFRIQNFARLSGPYDTWNVDYVYLNSGRSAGDNSYPDRTVSSGLNSLFVDYYAMPAKHFLANPAQFLKHPSLELYNLRVGNIQPFDYDTKAVITTRIGQQTPVTTNVTLDVAQDPVSTLNGLQFLNLTLNKIPSVSDFNPLADSIGVQLHYKMATKDNVPPSSNGDYDAARYCPAGTSSGTCIDFRYNDSTKMKYVLSSYYAYDDGTAEYGAGLNQAGSYLAFKFLNKSAVPDTVVAVDIYFPDFGNNTNQSLLLQIRSDLSDTPASILQQQSIQVSRTTQNKFVRFKLSTPVRVTGDFYVGWKQISSASIPVGLDKNNDQGDKIYYNTNGIWVQNVTVKGSVMVRAVFGNPHLGGGPITGVDSERVTPIYPNPTRGVCYLPVHAESVIAYDVTGRVIAIEIHEHLDSKSIAFLAPSSGIKIVRYLLNGKIHTEKVMVQAE
jgi:hypothetical protein